MTGWSKEQTGYNTFSLLRVHKQFSRDLDFWRLVHGLRWPWEKEEDR